MGDLEDNPLAAVSRVARPEPPHARSRRLHEAFEAYWKKREHMRLSEEALARRLSARAPDGVG